MAIRCNLWRAAMVLTVLLMPPKAGAQELVGSGEAALATAEHPQGTGILTDRLTKSRLKAWNAILTVVMARDQQGQLLHPKLYGLYQQADMSGKGIRIELSTRISPYGPVAWCKTRRQTDSAQEEPIVIRLNLGLIDGAVTSPLARRVNGFIPFAGLGKKERYAEALGHELAHAVGFLFNTEYMEYYQEVDRLRRVADGGPKGEAIERLISLIEKPAESAELEIWQELRGR